MLKMKKGVRERQKHSVGVAGTTGLPNLSETAVTTWFLLGSISFQFPFCHSFGRLIYYHTGITIIIVIINPFFYTDNNWKTV